MNDEDGLTVEESQELDRLSKKLTHYTFLCLRLARAVDNFPKTKRLGIWSKFRFVMEMKKERSTQ